jgi:hypothetical protein
LSFAEPPDIHLWLISKAVACSLCHIVARLPAPAAKQTLNRENENSSKEAVLGNAVHVMVVK